ncbi:DAK2 domain-containing protein [Streptomyces sp. NBC_00820]|uniref:DAK2 domain-containing protein n=1 Tax=Streptomyces sp. NBC_00820 TaxID=2975842 RepID=UPI002ED4293F|nr:DAK2 domain-containing protein [Streptomyces sp. NBC_00820]
MAQVPQTFLDALAVRTWCVLALGALGRAREEIDAINVYPVADGDTGTNLYLTLESAATAVEAVFAGYETGTGRPSLADAVHAMAHGALIGARGNSGTILAQLLRGMAQVLAAEGAAGTGRAEDTEDAEDSEDTVGTRRAGDAPHVDGAGLGLALRHAADSAREAVAHPVEGTVLTVASAAADAAERTEGDCGTVARAAYEGAWTALAATPGQLPALRRAGVVDAGGRGLVAVLGALVEAVTGEAVAEEAPGATAARPPEDSAAASTASAAASLAAHARVGDVSGPADLCADGTGASGPAFEVIYLLEAGDEAVARLRERLDALGDSLVVVGGDGLWNVHVHVDDAGAAVEAGIEAGRPYRIRITHFGPGDVHTGGERPPRERVQRAVVAVVPGEGLAGLYTEAGATTILARPGEPPAGGELVQALRRAHAREVVLLPNDAELRLTAAAAAEQARAEGIRVALIPTRSAVQGIAALAVHEPERRFDEDVVQMTSAAGATRYAEVVVAERQAWTSAGICQAGDVLGLIDGDVAVIGPDVISTAETVLDRMLRAGGELVTLVTGDETPETVATHLETRVRETYLAVDTVVYRGGRQGALLLIGVE